MDAFCRDIGGMFDVEMVCRQQDIRAKQSGLKNN
jgi:hypothetical protein